LAIDRNFVAQINGRRLGERGLFVTLDVSAHFGESLFKAINENIATSFGDIEQTNGETTERFRSADSFNGGGAAFVGRVEHNAIH
jgi:hypothetical protein